MRLCDVGIEGFGVWSGLHLHNLSPQCTVFYGPNEAGKTTILQFLRAVLYGFSPARTARYVPPARSAVAGGSLVISSPADGDLTILRQWSAANSLGDVVIHGVDEASRGAPPLQELLRDIDEATFNNIFAVGLRELQELATLTDLDAASWLYSLTTGFDRVSLHDILAELENGRAQVLASDNRPCQIRSLVEQRNSIRRELKELSSLSDRYQHLVDQQADVDRQIADAETRISCLDGDHRTLEAASLVYDTWKQRSQLDAQIAALKTGELWPDHALLRMERVSAAIEKARGRIRQAKKQRRVLKAELDKLAPNGLILRQSAKIAALAENEVWISGVEQELGMAESSVQSLIQAQQTQQHKLANSPEAAIAGVQHIDPGLWQRLKFPAAALGRARRRIKAVHRKATQEKQGLEDRRKQIGAALFAVGRQDVNTAVEAAGQRVSQLRRRAQLDEQIQQLAESQADLEAQATELGARQVLPQWMVVALGAAFAVGAMLTLAGLFLPATFTGSLGWPLAIVGAIVAASAAGGKFALERSLATKLAECEKQLAQVQSRAEQTDAERAQIDASLPKATGSVAARLQNAQAELAKLEELLPLNAERQTVEQQLREMDERFELAKSKLRKAKCRWRRALSAAGLNDALTPRQVRNLAATGASAAGMDARLGEAQSDLDRRRRELAALCLRIQQIYSAGAIRPESNLPSAQIRQLRQSLAEEESTVQTRDLHARRIRILRRKQTAIEERLQRLKRRRRSLLKDCNVTDVEAFQRRAAEVTRLATFTSQRDSAARDIASLLAGSVTEPTISEIVSAKSADEVQSQFNMLTEQLEAARAVQRRLMERRGQLGEQLLQMAADRGIAAKRFELGKIESQIGSALRRWRLLSMTQNVMEEIKADYERNRQPQTLREASLYLAHFTGGRYHRIWTPIGEQILLVDDSHGRSLPVVVLSQGTREQLFLSLRLALVSLFARRGARLPIILDDVLVNFDTDRATAAAAVLRDFAAAGHQLLIFTCHEHVARLFKCIGMDVRRLPDNTQPGRDLPFEGDEAASSPVPQTAVENGLEPESPQPRHVEFVKVSTAVPAAELSPLIEVNVQPAAPRSNVDVQIVHSPVMAELWSRQEPELESQSPEPRAIKRRKSKLRVDPPQQVVRISPIRRRWAAEEFSGELDDRINALWLLGGNAGSVSMHGDRDAEELPSLELSLSETAIVASVDSSRSGRVISALKQFHDGPSAPPIIELAAESEAGPGDEYWDT